MTEHEPTEDELKDMKRAVRALFRVLYGAKPTVFHRAYRTEDDADDDPVRHCVTLRAPATERRGEVFGQGTGHSKWACYCDLVGTMGEAISHLDDAAPDFDDWIRSDDD